jgi:hypothetical protein
VVEIMMGKSSHPTVDSGYNETLASVILLLNKNNDLLLLQPLPSLP